MTHWLSQEIHVFTKDGSEETKMGPYHFFFFLKKDFNRLLAYLPTVEISKLRMVSDGTEEK